MSVVLLLVGPLVVYASVWVGWRISSQYYRDALWVAREERADAEARMKFYRSLLDRRES